MLGVSPGWGLGFANDDQRGFWSLASQRGHRPAASVSVQVVGASYSAPQIGSERPRWGPGSTVPVFPGIPGHTLGEKHCFRLFKCLVSGKDQLLFW